MKFFFLLALLSVLSLPARAVELFEYGRPARALGMGGVYLPFISETDAVLWNPAALSRVKKLSWDVVQLGVGANGKDALELVDIVSDENCDGAECFGEIYGMPLWFGLDGATKLAAPRVGAAIFGTAYLSGMLNNPAFPNLELTYLTDYGYAAAYGFPINESLDMGVTLKRIHRRGGTQQISLSTITGGDYDAIVDEFDQRGVGYGMDLGLQWMPPGKEGTVLGVHWQDVGSTAFQPEGDRPTPPRIKDNLSLGIGHEINLPALDLRAGIEYRHITLQGEQIGKKLHLGTEVSLPLIDLRAGLNQGFPTLGAGVDLSFFRLEAASYTEETGVYPGQNPSRRYKAELSLNISVDADFSLTTSDGRKRKLKQRR